MINHYIFDDLRSMYDNNHNSYDDYQDWYNAPHFKCDDKKPQNVSQTITLMLITKAVMSIHQCQYEDDQCTHDDGHCKYVGMPSDMWRQVMVYVWKTNPLHVDCHDFCDDVPLYVS